MPKKSQDQAEQTKTEGRKTLRGVNSDGVKRAKKIQQQQPNIKSMLLYSESLTKPKKRE